MTHVWLTCEIQGTPKPQGSMMTSATSAALWYPEKTKLHRNYVIDALRGWWEYEPATMPIQLDLLFRMPRPAWHFGTGRNAGVLKASSPAQHTQTPDLDKLVRLVGDALVGAGVIHDDSQIHTIHADKVWLATDASVGSTRVRVGIPR